MRWPLSAVLYPCDRVRDMLYDVLEGTLPRSAALRFRLHLSVCARCRQYMRLYRMAAGMGAFRKDNPPPAFMDRTLDFLERQGVAFPEPPDPARERPGHAPGSPIGPDGPPDPDAGPPPEGSKL